MYVVADLFALKIMYPSCPLGAEIEQRHYSESTPKGSDLIIS
jgi:hypothetical protein